jgi:hypothetical protein
VKPVPEGNFDVMAKWNPATAGVDAEFLHREGGGKRGDRAVGERRLNLRIRDGPDACNRRSEWVFRTLGLFDGACSGLHAHAAILALGGLNRREPVVSSRVASHPESLRPWWRKLPSWGGLRR